VNSESYSFRNVVNISYANRTFVSALAFIPDENNYRTGNSQLNDVISFAIEQWASELNSSITTKYGDAFANNFISN